MNNNTLYHTFALLIQFLLTQNDMIYAFFWCYITWTWVDIESCDFWFRSKSREFKQRTGINVIATVASAEYNKISELNRDKTRRCMLCGMVKWRDFEGEDQITWDCVPCVLAVYAYVCTKMCVCVCVCYACMWVSCVNHCLVSLSQTVNGTTKSYPICDLTKMHRHLFESASDAIRFIQFFFFFFFRSFF